MLILCVLVFSFCRRQNSVGRLSEVAEQDHEYFTELQTQANEIDKQIEITQPLINLLDNMVTMGSLYGADNLLYAAEYKKVVEMLYILLFIGTVNICYSAHPRPLCLGGYQSSWRAYFRGLAYESDTDFSRSFGLKQCHRLYLFCSFLFMNFYFDLVD